MWKLEGKGEAVKGKAEVRQVWDRVGIVAARQGWKLRQTGMRQTGAR